MKLQAPSVDRELRDVAARFDLLRHPFYKRWAAGQVTRSELAYYAAQYAHVVQAVPRWLSRTADLDPQNREHLQAHAAEESAHVDLWERFASALGWEQSDLRAQAPNQATKALLATGDDLTEQGHGAAVVWSIEGQSPAVSAEKLRGLRAHYGIDERTGGEYFAVHEMLDRDHEARLRDIIRASGSTVRSAAPAAAVAALAGMWDLLSSVQAV